MHRLHRITKARRRRRMNWNHRRRRMYGRWWWMQTVIHSFSLSFPLPLLSQHSLFLHINHYQLSIGNNQCKHGPMLLLFLSNILLFHLHPNSSLFHPSLNHIPLFSLPLHNQSISLPTAVFLPYLNNPLITHLLHPQLSLLFKQQPMYNKHGRTTTGDTVNTTTRTLHHNRTTTMEVVCTIISRYDLCRSSIICSAPIHPPRCPTSPPQHRSSTNSTFPKTTRSTNSHTAGQDAILFIHFIYTDCCKSTDEIAATSGVEYS